MKNENNKNKKRKLTERLSNYLNKEIKFTNADDIAMAIILMTIIILNIITISGLCEIYTILKQ